MQLLRLDLMRQDHTLQKREKHARDCPFCQYDFKQRYGYDYRPEIHGIVPAEPTSWRVTACWIAAGATLAVFVVWKSIIAGN
jgi:hypothetical protein